MGYQIILRCAVIGVLLGIFLSCSPVCRQWEYDEICTSCPYYNSKIIVLPPDNPFRGLELAISRTRSGQRMYLNIFSLAFPCEEAYPNKTQIRIQCGTVRYEHKAERLQGGQRLLLSKEMEELIITQLLEGKSFTISVGRYSSEIIPRKFAKVYQKFHAD